MSSVFWLIDGSYLYKSMKKYGEKNRCKFNLDYNKLREKIENQICKDSTKFTAYYFNSTPDPATDKQNAFHRWLKSAKPDGPSIRVELYSLKTITVECEKCNYKFKKPVQKGVDVGIVTAALKFHQKYDTLILSTGDGDFEDTLKYLKEDLDKNIIIVSFRHGLSSDLQQYADKVFYIDEFADEVRDTRAETALPFDNVDSVIEE